MIVIVNGPNLNLLGKREPRIYGSQSFEDFLSEIRGNFPDTEVEYFQSNSEGALIDYIQQAGFNPDVKGVVLNPGAYAHYSYAIADAIRAIPVPVVEVHISNIYAREEFRQKSVTAAAAKGVITGLGFQGYKAAIEYLLTL